MHSRHLRGGPTPHRLLRCHELFALFRGTVVSFQIEFTFFLAPLFPQKYTFFNHVFVVGVSIGVEERLMRLEVLVLLETAFNLELGIYRLLRLVKHIIGRVFLQIPLADLETMLLTTTFFNLLFLWLLFGSNLFR